jgi:hypothetical protein
MGEDGWKIREKQELHLFWVKLTEDLPGCRPCLI